MWRLFLNIKLKAENGACCGLWVVIVLEIFCKTACLSRAQERDDVLPLLEKAARVQQFNLLYPQEKVYLHFDNTG